jgi:uncharacterized membrane protein
MWGFHLTETWASVYANSSTIRTLLGFAHVAGLIVGGGSAIAADRGVLRALRRAPSELSAHLTAIRGVHSVVIASLAVVMASGLLLAAADTETFLHSTLFWLKMGLVGLLIVNGAVMRFAERAASGTRPRWTPLAIASGASLTLWLLTTLAGAALPNVH